VAAQRQIALLRGINLVKVRRVSMPELRELLNGLGYGDVRTLLQSGNVVLTSELEPARLESALEKQIAEGLGVDTRVLVRTRDELAGVIDRNPLATAGRDPRRIRVGFLSGDPDPEAVRELAAADMAPEEFAASGHEVYSWHPDGFQASRLLKLLSEERLGVVATARNWATVTKLLALADA
jgi:uncharacterized protein (DUF1697 family)